MPLLSASGNAKGTLCANPSKPRTWSKLEIATLEDLAATVIAYIERTPNRPAAGAEGLNIAAVARRTGIGADTLRKWERRYGVLRPNRTTGGQRRYDERDVARVKWLRDRLAEGFRISEAAALLADDAATTTSSTSGLRDAIVAATSDPDARQRPRSSSRRSPFTTSRRRSRRSSRRRCARSATGGAKAPSASQRSTC